MTSPDDAMINSTDETTDAAWWRSAVVYQVYPRSFADGDGDGVGDIAGIRARLGYLAELGVDALWINPWYPSPMKDAGYDVADFRDIEPVFGDLEQATALLAEAHQHGLRVLLDLVPNHTSDQHRWFRAAVTADPGSPERDRFFFRDGRGVDGTEPPNDWQSTFGGPAWTRVAGADGAPGQWYLHLFAPEQPDVNWANADVVHDFEETLRFWYDRGVDGFRIDVAHGLVKDPDLADIGGLVWPQPLAEADPDAEGGLAVAVTEVEHPHWDRDALHDIYRSWRAIADEYDPPRVYAGEIWVGRLDRLARYLRPDELHTAFNFEYLFCPWRAPLLRQTIDDTLGSHASVGAPPTWVLSNHDVPREVSRYARPQPEDLTRTTVSHLLAEPPDWALGLRRARAAALLMLALPGSAYVYQGGELGLAEVEDIPEDRLQDPIFVQSGGQERGRDGCRVPLPWSGDRSPYGFSPDTATGEPWLPQPTDWAGRTVQAQTGDPTSTLELYRAAFRLRRATTALGDGPMDWLPSPDGVLAFGRGDGFVCLVNVDTDPVDLPAGATVLLASDELVDGRLPTATAVWLTT